MVQLETKQPGVFREFMEGNFLVQRSHHKFSMIGKDQSHEQSAGRYPDLFDDTETLALYMLATPD